MNFSLVRAILNDSWSISLQYYLQYNRIADAILSGIHFEIDENSIEPYTQLFDLQSASYVNAGGENKSRSGLVAVHSVIGPMLKYDTTCGPVGTKTISKAILNADKKPEVIAHVVVYDTGGGQSGSVNPLHEAFDKSTKPVVAFVDGNMHSAGLFSAVKAKEIVALPGSFVGSIGTFISIEGLPQNHTAEDGTVYRRIYATTSGKKNEEYEEALKGNDKPIQKTILDPHDKMFMDCVKTNRPNITDEQLEGGIFQVEKVVGSLVDSIGDLDFAIARAAKLGNAQKKANTNSQNSQNMNKPDFSVLATAAGLPSLEVADGGIFLSTEQAEAVQTAYSKNLATIQAYSGLKDGESVEDLRNEINTLTESNKELTGKNETLTAENEELSKETVDETGTQAGGDNDKEVKSSDPEAEHFYNLSQMGNTE